MRAGGLRAAGGLAVALALAGCSPSVSEAEVAAVRIVGDGESSARFDPAVVTVPLGGEVRWRNETSLGCAIIAADGSWELGVLRSGQTAAQRFDRVGPSVYTCAPSDGTTLTGVVEVVEP